MKKLIKLPTSSSSPLNSPTSSTTTASNFSNDNQHQNGVISRTNSIHSNSSSTSSNPPIVVNSMLPIPEVVKPTNVYTDTVYPARLNRPVYTETNLPPRLLRKYERGKRSNTEALSLPLVTSQLQSQPPLPPPPQSTSFNTHSDLKDNLKSIEVTFPLTSNSFYMKFY